MERNVSIVVVGDILVGALQRNRPNGRYTYKEIYLRNWLMLSWRPRSSIICCLQAGHPGELVV